MAFKAKIKKIDNNINLNSFIAQQFYGAKYTPYKFRKKISLNINHYLYLNLIKGSKTLSSLLRKIIVNGEENILIESIKNKKNLCEYIYDTPKNKNVKVSIGFKTIKEYNELVKSFKNSEGLSLSNCINDCLSHQINTTLSLIDSSNHYLKSLKKEIKGDNKKVIKTKKLK